MVRLGDAAVVSAWTLNSDVHGNSRGLGVANIPNLQDGIVLSAAVQQKQALGTAAIEHRWVSTLKRGGVAREQSVP